MNDHAKASVITVIVILMLGLTVMFIAYSPILAMKIFVSSIVLLIVVIFVAIIYYSVLDIIQENKNDRRDNF